MHISDLYIRQKPATLERLIEIAKIQSTESSNSIEGIVTTKPRLKELMEDKTTPKNRDEEALKEEIIVSQHITSLENSIRFITPQDFDFGVFFCYKPTWKMLINDLYTIEFL